MATKSAQFVASSSQFLSRANSSPLNIASNSFTIEFWVKTPRDSSGVLMGKDDASLGRNYAFYFDHITGKIGVQFAGNAEAYNSTALSANTWYHFALTCNGSTAQYYLNGSADGTGSYHSWTPGTGPTTLGCRSYSGAENFVNCKLFNVRIWNIVRSGSDINANKSVVIATASGLVASWVLNDSLVDLTSNALTLTNTNAVAFVADAPFDVSTVPTLDTSAVTDITSVSATANGEITDVGSGDCSQRGFVYSTTTHSDPGNVAPASTDYESVESESGTFSADVFDLPLTSLTDTTEYFVRAFAQNADGYAYGPEVSFTTDAPPPFRFENLPGVTYNPDDTVTIYAERLNDILDRLDALEA